VRVKERERERVRERERESKREREVRICSDKFAKKVVQKWLKKPFGKSVMGL